MAEKPNTPAANDSAGSSVQQSDQGAIPKSTTKPKTSLPKPSPKRDMINKKDAGLSDYDTDSAIGGVSRREVYCIIMKVLTLRQ